MAACSGRRQFKFPRGRSYNENRSAWRKLFPGRVSRVYNPHPLFFSSASPRNPLVVSHGACSARIVCVHGPRSPCKPRAPQTFFFFFSLSPFFPRNVEFHGSRHTALFHFLAAYSRGENKTAGIFQTYWPGDECTPRPEVFLYFAQFHSSRIYGVTRERYTHVSEKMVEDSRAFYLLKGRFKNYYFYRFYEK